MNLINNGLKLNPIKANMTELKLNDGKRILFSYRTPVAYYEPRGQFYFVTDKWYSQTTMRHINQWIAPLHYAVATQIPQAEIDNLVVGVK